MTKGEKKVLAEVREIIQDVDDDAETPGGVEHLGDFRRLIRRWARLLADEQLTAGGQEAHDSE